LLGCSITWFRNALDEIAPSALRQTERAGGRRLREGGKIRDILGQIVALVFDRLIRFQRSGLVLIEPVNLLADA
jgi:hypothetical protein